MKLLKRGRLLLFLKLTLVLGSLWMLSLLTRPKAEWSLTYILRYSWLKYTDEDDSPEKVCNCSAILQGEREALEEAKLLAITKEFRKTVRIPDEYYINASQDCRCVSLNYIFWYHTLPLFECTELCTCRQFKLSRKYLTFPLSQEEADFPLAYSIVVHHKVCKF